MRGARCEPAHEQQEAQDTYCSQRSWPLSKCRLQPSARRDADPDASTPPERTGSPHARDYRVLLQRQRIRQHLGSRSKAVLPLEGETRKGAVRPGAMLPAARPSDGAQRWCRLCTAQDSHQLVRPQAWQPVSLLAGQLRARHADGDTAKSISDKQAAARVLAVLQGAGCQLHARMRSQALSTHMQHLLDTNAVCTRACTCMRCDHIHAAPVEL